MGNEEKANPNVDHKQMAELIHSKNLGDVFTLDWPADEDFSPADFFMIQSLFDQLRPQKFAITKFIAGFASTFMISTTQDGIVRVYKDNANNLAFYRTLEEKLLPILEAMPYLYPRMINMLIDVIPDADQEALIEMEDTYTGPNELVMNVERVPINVIKAMVKLLVVPESKSGLVAINVRMGGGGEKRKEKKKKP